MAIDKQKSQKPVTPKEENRWENEGGHLPESPAKPQVPPTSPPDHFPGAQIVKILNNFLREMRPLRPN